MIERERGGRDREHRDLSTSLNNPRQLISGYLNYNMSWIINFIGNCNVDMTVHNCNVNIPVQRLKNIMV